MRAFSIAAAALVLAGCSPYKVLRQASPNPFAGETSFAVLPVEWNGIIVDGDAESVWERYDVDTRREWPGYKASATELFARAFYDASSPTQLRPVPTPSTQGFTVKCVVHELKTGGLKPLELTVRLQLIDGNGAVVDEAETTAKGKAMRGMQIMLNEAAVHAGDALGQYLRKRAKP
jgi:hypothetical protein